MSRSRLASLAAPLALALAGATVARFAVDRASSAPTLFWSLVGAGVLASLAASAPRASRLAPAAALALFGALAFLPASSPLPSAAVAALLTAALGIALAERVDARTPPDGIAILGLALGAQLVALAERLLLAPLSASTWAALTLTPLAVALVLAWVAGHWPAAALALGLSTFAAGPGWHGAGLVSVGVGAAALAVARARGWPRLGAAAVVVACAAPHLPAAAPWLVLALAASAAAALASDRLLARAGAATLGAAALAALIAGALPWRAAPALESALASALGRPFSEAAQALPGRALVLSTASPRAELPLDPALGAARGVAVRTYLTNAVELPCGTVVARVALVSGGAVTGELALEIGRDTADWAVQRPDVAGVLACPAPRADWSWIPASGRFLGSTFRARAAWPVEVAVERVRLERAPGLPGEVAIAFFDVEVER
jgi:hypothetical protein